jgi:hypothetical protein
LTDPQHATSPQLQLPLPAAEGPKLRHPSMLPPQEWLPYLPRGSLDYSIIPSIPSVIILSHSIAMGYELDGRDRIPCRGKIVLAIKNSRPALACTQTPVQWVSVALSHYIKQLE